MICALVSLTASAADRPILVTKKTSCVLDQKNVDYGMNVEVANFVLKDGRNVMQAKVSERSIVGGQATLIYPVVPYRSQTIGGSAGYISTRSRPEGEFGLAINYTATPMPGMYPRNGILIARRPNGEMIQAKLRCRDDQPFQVTTFVCNNAHQTAIQDRILSVILAERFDVKTKTRTTVATYQITGYDYASPQLEFPVVQMATIQPMPMPRPAFEGVHVAFQNHPGVFELMIDARTGRGMVYLRGKSDQLACIRSR